MNIRSFHPKRLLDWWSVPHFLFGMVMALIAITFSFSPLFIFLMTFILAVVWEWFEQRFRISEAPGNGTMDVLLPLIAFSSTFLFVDRVYPNPEHYRALLIVVTLLYIFTNFFAWRARFDRDREFMG